MLYDIRSVDNKPTLTCGLYRGEMLLQSIVKNQKVICKCHMQPDDVLDKSTIRLTIIPSSLYVL